MLQYLVPSRADFLQLCNLFPDMKCQRGSLVVVLQLVTKETETAVARVPK